MMSQPTEVAALEKHDRPFPWHCPKCRRKEVWRVSMPYEFQCRRLGEEMTVRIDALAVPCCKHCGELVFDYAAHDQLRLAADRVQASVNATGQPIKKQSPAPTVSST